MQFFIKYDLIPGETHISISDLETFLAVIFAAQSESISFAKFVREALIGVGYYECILSFDTWEELLDSYYTFVASYAKDTNSLSYV